MENAAPVKSVAVDIAARFRPQSHHLDDGQKATATTEIIAETVGEMLARQLGAIALPQPALVGLGAFDRKALAVNKAVAERVHPGQTIAPFGNGAGPYVPFREIRSLDAASQLIAASGTTLAAFRFSPAELSQTSASRHFPNGGEIPWLALPIQFAAPADEADQQWLNALLIDLRARLDQSPWDHCRRLCIDARCSTDGTALLGGFALAFVSLSATWPDSFFFEYCLRTITLLDPEELDTEGATAAMMLARCAHSRALGRRAVAALEKFDSSDAPDTIRARFALELANVHAQNKDAAATARAEALAEAGLAAATQDPMMTARLLNVLALVRYRQGRDDEALRLERVAWQKAESVDDPAALAWAGTALLSNIAKLLEVRFGDRQGALDTYLEGACRETAIGSVRARLHAARLLLKGEAWREVLDLLGSVRGSNFRTTAEQVHIELLLAAANVGLRNPAAARSHLVDAQGLIARYPANPLSADIAHLVLALAPMVTPRRPLGRKSSRELPDRSRSASVDV
ncbi:hypothetical protein [Sphingomonas colocasiae]|uniref:Tetratricopeptide repeat protein n=1 Tax=Sphingomonas colocasiae TaxID=1848973 RepID=A0ABS7PWV5_9SPHN|nr:hypothetical protein [Sphingomonas colocasiae]MBY8825135.1 hypothetical protein [Sphingomonas colocasiae]